MIHQLQTVSQIVATLVAASPGDLIRVATPGEVTGLTFNGVGLDASGIGWNIHGNTFSNIPATVPGANPGCAISGSPSNSHIDNNIFTGIASTAIFCYPGSNVTFNGNHITNAGEGIHLMGPATPGGSDTISVCNNVLTGITGNGMELQNALTNLTVTGNYISLVQPAAPASRMGVSAAAGFGSNINISNNTLVSSRVAGAAIEIMGSGITIDANTVWGFDQFILNGAQGGPFTVSNNTVCGDLTLVAKDGVSWMVVTPAMTNNVQSSLSAVSAPLPPLPVVITPAVVTPPAKTAVHTLWSDGSWT